MTIKKVAEVLEGSVVAGVDDPREVGAVVASDLMSDVLLFDSDDMLLITSLASEQSIRTANIVGAMGVVVHNAKPLPEAMCKAAETLGIPLVSSPLAKYESCVRLHAALEAEKKA